MRTRGKDIKVSISLFVIITRFMRIILLLLYFPGYDDLELHFYEKIHASTRSCKRRGRWIGTRRKASMDRIGDDLFLGSTRQSLRNWRNS
jgi:hypothetical protein